MIMHGDNCSTTVLTESFRISELTADLPTYNAFLRSTPVTHHLCSTPGAFETIESATVRL